MTRRAGREHDESGTAAVEFVLVLPFALGLIALVLFAGWLGLTRVILDHGAREGARALSMPTADDLRTYPDDAAVAVAVEAATPLISPTAVTTEPGDPTVGNAPLVLMVTYDVANPVAVLLGPLELFGVDNPAPANLTLTSTAKARRE